MGHVEYRILGPLEVTEGGQALFLGVGRQRKLLAILLVQANEVVSSDRLIDALWGDRPPETVAKALQGHVSQLRKLLGAAAVVTQAPGYALRVDPGQLDADRFELLVAEARRADPAEAAGELAEALALWRGPALPEFAYDAFAQGEIGRLEGLRLSALEARIDADLAVGRHSAVVAELETLVAAHPLRERLRGQLMLALYRCGRQVEALGAYRDGRRVLIEELGLEPGEELQQLERSILAHDPAIDPPPPPSEAPPGQAPKQERRRRPLRIATVAALLLVMAGGIAAAAVRLTSGGSPAVVVDPDSVAVVDPATNRVYADVRVGARPVAVAAGAGAVWVANADDQTLSRIDPKTMREVGRIGIGTDESGLAVGYGSVWVAGGNDGTLTRVDADSNVVQEKLTLGRRRALSQEPVFAVAAGAGGVWATVGNSVVRIDPTTYVRTRRIAVNGPNGIAVGNGAVWVTTSTDRVLRFDAKTGAKTASISVPGPAIAPVLGGGSLWLIVRAGTGEIWRLNAATAETTGTTAGGFYPIALAWGAGSVWVANEVVPTVWRIDPSSHRVRSRVILRGEVTSVTVSDGAVWVAIQTAI